MTIIQEIAKKYCPIFYFDKNENNFPVDISYLVAQSDLYYNNSLILSREERFSKYSVSDQNNCNHDAILGINVGFTPEFFEKNTELEQILSGLKENANVQLKYKDTNYSGGGETVAKDTDDVSITCVISDVQENSENCFIFLSYKVLFANSGTNEMFPYSMVTLRIKCDNKPFVGTSSSNKFGFDIQNDSLDKVFIKSHNQDLFFNPSKILHDSNEFTASKTGNHIKIYVEKNFHNLYPGISKNDIPHHMGDKRTEEGRRWDPEERIILLPSSKLTPDNLKKISHDNVSVETNYLINLMNLPPGDQGDPRDCSSIDEVRKIYSFVGKFGDNFSPFYSHEHENNIHYETTKNSLPPSHLVVKTLGKKSTPKIIIFTGVIIFCVIMTLILPLWYTYNTTMIDRTKIKLFKFDIAPIIVLFMMILVSVYLGNLNFFI
jgi:hypothetical protein